MVEMMAYGMTLRHVFSLCAFFVTKKVLIGLGAHKAMLRDVVV
jgi:hypothetical protein